MTCISGQSIDRYHIVEPLGRGGMAVVYRAYDTRLERDVALKLIRMEAFPKEDHERVLKRFDREAHALAKLSHPGIVRVHDYGEHDGAPYLVMEYLGGRTLKEREEKRLPAARAAELLMPVAEALAYAHGQGILHRDVKPSNILLNDVGEAVLTDFGIAKVLEGNEEQTLTGTGVGVGTPEYMAPEQGLGGEVDGRADVYSLGVVLYELVTGEKPYTAETPMAVVIKQINDPLPGPRSKVPELPVSAERVLLKALAKKPEHRYQDMAAFAAALSQLAQGVDIGYEPAGDKGTDARGARGSHYGAFGALESAGEHERLELEPGVEAARGGRKRRILPLVVGILVLAGGGFAGWRVMGNTDGNVVEPAMMAETGMLEATEAALMAELEAVQTSNAASSTGTAQAVVLEAQATATITPVPTLGVGSSRVSEADGMVQVYVPEGTFTMGSPEHLDRMAYLIRDHEFPEHDVFLDAFWIDQTEVTNGLYAMCVDAGECAPPYLKSSEDRSHYFGLSEYEDYPVINVTWHQAVSYCEWAGRRLLTEAEWEKAARGPDGRMWPWGNIAVMYDRVNFCDVNCNADYRPLDQDDGYGDTAPVGTYPKGASPYGALDMAGNVREWVADWYGSDYYSRSPLENPLGPSTGINRVHRGGSYLDIDMFVRTTYRLWNNPVTASPAVGFRCGSTADGVDGE